MSISNGSAERFLLGFVSSCLIFAAGPVWAGKASFGIPPSATSASSGGTSISSTVGLPASGTNGFNTNFVLPKGYVKNAPIKIVFYGHTASPGCNARILPSSVSRKRLGAPLGTNLTGVIALQGSPLLTLPGDGTVQPVAIEIGPGNGLTGQKAGDTLLINMKREADHASDTCVSTVFIHGINVIYPTP